MNAASSTVIGAVKWRRSRSQRRAASSGSTHGSGRSAAGSVGSTDGARCVTGRHWSRWRRPPSNAHSTSTGQPCCPSSSRASSATSASCAGSSEGRAFRKLGTATSRAAPSAVIVIRSFSAIRSSTVSSVALSRCQVSGVTVPFTMLSPRPQEALITMRSSRPETGSTLKVTPDASARTMRCTRTASARPVSGSPCARRYVSADSERSERQVRSTAASTASRPTTFSTVSCWPANDAVGPSSSSAEERTATGEGAPP